MTYYSYETQPKRTEPVEKYHKMKLTESLEALMWFIYGLNHLLAHIWGFLARKHDILPGLKMRVKITG